MPSKSRIVELSHWIPFGHSCYYPQTSHFGTMLQLILVYSLDLETVCNVQVCMVFVIILYLQVNWAILLPAQSFWIILLARFISGIGSAGAITVVSIYNNEVASPLKKASLGNLLKSRSNIVIFFQKKTSN